MKILTFEIKEKAGIVSDIEKIIDESNKKNENRNVLVKFGGLESKSVCQILVNDNVEIEDLIFLNGQPSISETTVDLAIGYFNHGILSKDLYHDKVSTYLD